MINAILYFNLFFQVFFFVKCSSRRTAKLLRLSLSLATEESWSERPFPKVFLIPIDHGQFKISSSTKGTLYREKRAPYVALTIRNFLPSTSSRFLITLPSSMAAIIFMVCGCARPPVDTNSASNKSSGHPGLSKSSLKQ